MFLINISFFNQFHPKSLDHFPMFFCICRSQIPISDNIEIRIHLLETSDIFIEHLHHWHTESFSCFGYFTAMLICACQEKNIFSKKSTSSRYHIGEDHLQCVSNVRSPIHIGDCGRDKLFHSFNYRKNFWKSKEFSLQKYQFLLFFSLPLALCIHLF